MTKAKTSQNDAPEYDGPGYEEAAAPATTPATTTSLVTRPNQMMQTAGANALVQRTLGEVQVAVMMAKQFPRDKIESRDKLINACCGLELATLAVYSYSRGGTEITGPTIRMAEAAKRAWGNMQSGYRELSRMKGPDGVGVSEVEAFAWDTENNTRESTTITVRHWRDTKKGGYALTDERDIRELLSNQAKRIERTCILNSIDGDLIEGALSQVAATLASKVQVTPETIASMVKKFEDFKVTPEQLAKRIQRRIEAINGPLMVSLGKIYNSLKDGMSKAEDWFEPEVAVEPADEEPKGGNAKVKAALAKKAAKAGADPETGELPAEKSGKQPEGEPEESPAPALGTAQDARKAGDALVLALNAAPHALATTLFIVSHGPAIVDALRSFGDGMTVAKIKQYVKLPE